MFIQAKPEVGWQPKTDERVIPISPTVRQLLFEQYANRTSEQWVFAISAGKRDGHILEKLKNVCRRAHIKPATVHALRHSFGAHLRMAGVSLADIADLLGHKDLATTQIYAKVQQKHLRTVIGKLTGLVPAAEPSDASLKTRHSGRPDVEPRPETLDRWRLGRRGQWDGGESGTLPHAICHLLQHQQFSDQRVVVKRVAVFQLLARVFRPLPTFADFSEVNGTGKGTCGNGL